MASNGLPVYAQVAGDVPIGPAAARKCQNCLYFRHLELIGHRSIGLRRPPKAKVDNPISCASKWPVLARPRLAGFARPMTLANLAVCRHRVNHYFKATYKSGRQDLNLRPPGPKLSDAR